MTSEKRKVYMREYTRKNKERIKARALQLQIEKAMKDVASIEQKTKFVITTKDGTKYEI